MINHTNTMKRTLLLLLAFVALTAQAQQKNPRGVYKLSSMESTRGKFDAPFDQYKFCTDNVTLTLTIDEKNIIYIISDGDNAAFNYTGEEPDKNAPTASRIFNSDAKHFDLKWWSSFRNHVYFPENDWCTEHYEAGKYSPSGKAVFDALNDIPSEYKKESLYGTWCKVGEADDIESAKELAEELAADEILTTGPAVHFSKSHRVTMPDEESRGTIRKIETNGKTYYRTDGVTFNIHWLPGDYMAINSSIDKDKFSIYNRNKIRSLSALLELKHDYSIHNEFILKNTEKWQLVGVWYLASVMKNGKCTDVFDKDHYCRVKVYESNSEYACAEITDLLDSDTYSVYPHEYGKWTYKDGKYTEMGREGNLKVVDENTFTFEWEGMLEVWKKIPDIPTALSSYIVERCRSEKGRIQYMQERIKKYIFRQE